MSIYFRTSFNVVFTNDESQGGLLAFSKALQEQVLNSVAALDLLPIGPLPPRRRPVLSFDVSLAEDMVKNVLQVNKLVVLEVELDELSCRGLSGYGSRCQDVGQPELSVRHCVFRK